MRLTGYSFLLKGNFLRKLIFRAAGAGAVACLCLAIGTQIYYGRQVRSNRLRIERDIQRYFSGKTSFRDIAYRFPDRIVIDGFRIDSGGPAGDGSLSIPRVVVVLRFGMRPRRRQVEAARVVVPELKIERAADLAVLSREIRYILGRSRPAGQGFSLEVKRIMFPRSSGEPPGGYREASVILRHRPGELNIIARAAGARPLAGALRVRHEGEQFLLEDLTINGAMLNAKLWGSGQGRDIHLKGHGFWKEGRPEQQSLVDLRAHLVLSPENMRLNTASFLWNGHRVILSGSAAWDEPADFKLALTLSANDKDASWPRGLTGVDLDIDGVYLKRQLSADVRARVDLKGASASGRAFDIVQARFDKMRINFDDVNNISGSLEALYLRLPQIGQEIVLDKLGARWSAPGPGLRERLLRWNFSAAQGRLAGHVRWTAGTSPLQAGGRVSVKGLRVEYLKNFLFDFSRFSGTLQADLRWSYDNQWQSDGQARLESGVLRDSAMQKWLAAYFGLESLRTLEVDSFQSASRYRDGRWSFFDIRLRGPHAGLDGYLTLADDGLMRGDLTVAFDRRALAGSRRLRPLLKRIDQAADPLLFEFRLSGYRERVNVQWNPSELKSDIVNVIPGFMRRKIEKKLEDAI
jgi:hypothetical protein